jgi:hypothetical protein
MADNALKSATAFIFNPIAIEIGDANGGHEYLVVASWFALPFDFFEHPVFYIVSVGKLKSRILLPKWNYECHRPN